MKKAIKIILWSLLALILVLGGAMCFFIYKISYGFPVSYETDAPKIDFPEGRPAILLFSKTTGFRHSESIDASKPVFQELAKRNNWFVYETEDGGVFNPDQLRRFRAVVFNNSTGRVLNDEQENALAAYVEEGGSLIGIHGAGDNSHHWAWYEENLLGTRFSHHSLDPHLQKTQVFTEPGRDSVLTRGLPASWVHEDEWYVFLTQPKGVHILSYIDGTRIIPNGNMLWIKNKNFGMGKYHPIAWYRTAGKGKTFYTSMGHTAEAWAEPEFTGMVENAVNWTLKR